MMKVFVLLGGFDYEGHTLLGVFGSLEDLMQFVERKRSEYHCKPTTLGYDDLGYVESELGREIDQDGEIEYL